MALTGVLAYGITAFAHKTEEQVRLTISENLSQAGLGWVTVHVQGQQVELSGAAPSADMQKQAMRAASGARCSSWLGRLPCVQKVITSFGVGPIEGPAPGAPPVAAHQGLPQAALHQVDTAASPTAVAPPPGAPHATGEPTTGDPAAAAVSAAAVSAAAVSAAAVSAAAVSAAAVNTAAVNTAAAEPPGTSSALDFELKLKRKGSSLTWSGAIPKEAAAPLEQTLRTHFPSGLLSENVSLRDGAASPEWQPIASYAVELAARCEEGVVALRGNVLAVDCETQTVSAKDAMNGLLSTLPEGLTAGTVNVLAVEEVKSCEAALVKLVTRSQIRFTTNSAKLLPTSRPLLREIAHQLDRCPGVVVVEGHTDAQGVREENVTLSLNRARAVVSGLVGLGVPAARVRAEGFGPDKPLATNATATGRAQNRRIEFRVARNGIGGE